MRSVVDRNVVTRRIPVCVNFPTRKLVWKTQGQVSLWKKKCIFEDNIKTDRVEICCKVWDLIFLVSGVDKWQAVIIAVVRVHKTGEKS